MALFNIPKRQEQDIHSIFLKAQEEQKPKITIKGGNNSVLKQIETITKDIDEKLGKYMNNYLCITSDGEFIDYCKKAVEDGVIAIDTETTGLSFHDQGKLVGVCIQSENQKPAYVPVGHISVITEKLVSPQVSIEAIKEGMQILADSEAKLLWHEAYYDLVVIYLNTGVWLRADWDVKIAGWLLNENEPHNLKALYNKYIKNYADGVNRFGDLFGGMPFCYVPYNKGMIYGAHDAEMTLALYKFQKPYLTKGTQECRECDLEQSADILMNMELPLVRPLCEMRIDGIKIDYERAKELRAKYDKLRKKAEENYIKAVSVIKDKIMDYIARGGKLQYPPNFNSPTQQSIIFYDILQIGVIDKKFPRSVKSATLDTILSMDRFKNTPVYNIANTLSTVKEYDKLIGSFIDKMPEEARQYNGKIHCCFNQLGAKTGRFSSSEPK